MGYAEIVDSILDDEALVGNVREGAARRAMAMLYLEASRAVHELRGRGFRLRGGGGECFLMTLTCCGVDEAVAFERNGSAVSVRLQALPAVVGDSVDRSQELALSSPAMMQEHELVGYVKAAIALAVEALAHRLALD